MILKVKEKWEKLAAPSKSSIIFMFINYFYKGITLITAVLYTRLLSTDEYGIMSIFNSWMDVIGVFAMLSLANGVYNNGIKDFKDEENKFTSSLLVLSNLCTIITGIVMFLCVRYLGIFRDFSSAMWIVMFSYFIFSPAYEFLLVREKFKYRYKYIFLISILISICSGFLPVAGLLLIEKTAKIKIISERIVSIFIFVILYIFTLRKTKFRFDKKYWKYALKFNLPLVPHYLSLYILSSSDRIMLSAFAGSGYAGIYSLAYSLSSVVYLIWISINTSLFVYTYQCIDNKKYVKMKSIVKKLLILYTVICFMFVLFAKEIMSIIAPSSYAEGVYIIPSVVVSTIFMAIYCLFANVEFYHKSTTFIMASSIISAISNIILNYIFIPKYGFIAAGYTTCFSYAIQTILHYVNYKRIQKESLYDEKNILIIILISVIGMLLANVFYTLDYIRYIIIALIVIIICIKKKSIQKMILEIVRKDFE